MKFISTPERESLNTAANGGNSRLVRGFTKRDLIFSIITGLLTGLIFWRIMVFLGKPEIFGIATLAGVIVIPVLWIIGVNFGYFLGRWMPFFNQFGRFVAVGFTNAAVDFGVLNLQISLSGHTAGFYYSIFKAVSFVVAVTNSYILNKYWVFEAGESRGGSSELFKFLGVNVIAIAFNVGIASLVVNFVDPFGGLNAKVWANIGAVAGTACAIILTFTGSRFIVFKGSAQKLEQ